MFYAEAELQNVSVWKRMYTLQNSSYEMILYTMEPGTVVTEIRLHARKNGEGGNTLTSRVQLLSHTKFF